VILEKKNFSDPPLSASVDSLMADFTQSFFCPTLSGLGSHACSE
jgi:hypothetical protein